MAKTLFSVPTGENLLASSLYQRVIDEAFHSGVDIFLVGGYLRDLVLNKFNSQYELQSKDLDYAIVGSCAFDFAKQIANNLNGNFVALDRENDTARVVMQDGYVLDFAGCLGGSIENDMARRDFTINSLYLDPRQPENIIDLTTGIADIRNGVVRASEANVFESDPLRLLRAFRFASNLNFEINAETLKWIEQYSKGLGDVAGERVTSELFLAFKPADTKSILNKLAQTGLLEVIFPELTQTRLVTNNAYHHLNLFDHSLEAVIQAEKNYLEKPEVWSKTNLASFMAPGINCLSVCKIAALLHDIGKPSTWVITDEGKHTFIGHEHIGAQMVPAIAKRLRWSNALENTISSLIELHLRPGQLFHNTPATAKGINRLYKKSGENFPALILLSLGDLGATKGPQMTEDKSKFLAEKFYGLLSGFEEYCMTTKGMKRILDGHEIMELLDLAPGKELGDIMTALQEAQELQEVLTHRQAVDFVQSLHGKRRQS